jgi:hypothetical protein
MCCAQSRDELLKDGSSSSSAVKLLYYGQSYLQFTGVATGHLYHFSPLHPIQCVDPRDAASMMQTRMFRQVR